VDKTNSSSTIELLTREQAAQYGCATLSAFYDWSRRSIPPGPIPGTERCDRRAIGVTLDRWSRLDNRARNLSLEHLREARDAHQAQGRTPGPQTARERKGRDVLPRLGAAARASTPSPNRQNSLLGLVAEFKASSEFPPEEATAGAYRSCLERTRIRRHADRGAQRAGRLGLFKAWRNAWPQGPVKPIMRGWCCAPAFAGQGPGYISIKLCERRGRHYDAELSDKALD
jgi:hypothetical protein